MKTIRLPDPFPRGKAGKKLEFGSSAWAADSCLVEWSRLEREWLGAPGEPTGGSRPGAGRQRRLGGVMALLALAVAGVAWLLLL